MHNAFSVKAQPSSQDRPAAEGLVTTIAQLQREKEKSTTGEPRSSPSQTTGASLTNNIPFCWILVLLFVN